MRQSILTLFVVALLSMFSRESQAKVTIASKTFTENVLLGDIAAVLASSENIATKHLRGLGGTRIVFNALDHKEIDLYFEYTGTLAKELFKDKNWREELDKKGIAVTEPLGFNNTYAFAVTEKLAKELNLEKISDLKNHRQLHFGFGNEFLNRGDGWPGIKAAYDLNPSSVTGMQHELAYRGIAAGSIQLMDAYSTDANVKHYKLKTLIDDKKYFPEYFAVALYRKELARTHPKLVAALKGLEGSINNDRMLELNARVKIGKESSRKVASDFVEKTFSRNAVLEESNASETLVKNLLDHLALSGISLLAAILIAIPLGILAVNFEKFGKVILGIVSMVQTIPSLALLVFLIPLFGVGTLPALVALFMYSLLPIVQNTHQGIRDIPNHLRESATVMGLPKLFQIRNIDIPMAMPSILAGVKTAAVINIGTATLGAIIGAGGFGQAILTGIRLDDMHLILSGAIPACLLALLAQGMFDLLSYVLVPEPLRERSNT